MMSLSSSIVCVIGCKRPSRKARAGNGRIEVAIAHDARLPRPGPLLRGLKRGLNQLLDVVEAFAGGGPIGPRQRPHLLLHGLQPAALRTQELDTRRLDGRRVVRRLEGGARRPREFVERGEERGE